MRMLRHVRPVGEFRVVAKKKRAGEHFLNLDMITSLLTPPGRACAAPMISVVDSEHEDETSDDNETNDSNKWSMPQTSTVHTSVVDGTRYGYGFGGNKFHVFENMLVCRPCTCTYLPCF
jgi:hypothetical protein